MLRGWGAYFRVGNCQSAVCPDRQLRHERLALFLSKKTRRSGRHWKERYTWAFFQPRRRVSAEWNRHVAHGNADSDPMNDLGKPGAGEPHARFDEGRLETEPGLGTAAPAMKCVDSAGPSGHRASLPLYGASCAVQWVKGDYWRVVDDGGAWLHRDLGEKRLCLILRNSRDSLMQR